MQQGIQKKWIVNSAEESEVTGLSMSLGVRQTTARILVGRGITTAEDGRSFLAPSLLTMPDPLLFKDMQKAVDRALLAVIGGESVCVYGDYDVDGISGTALLVSFLRRIGLDCGYFIPSRFEDGYGLNHKSLEQIVRTGVRLIISVDCGITALEEAEYCRRAGVGLIILDHHAPKETVPDAVAVVNPLQSDCLYPFKLLAGVGVAFNFLVALRGRMRQEGLFEAGAEPDLRDWLDLVAIGTIADVVPLTGQNRVYAYYGLKRLENSSRPGISALKKVAGIKGEVSCGHVGFRLSPLLNAAGRMESAVPGVQLLLSGSCDESERIAEGLYAANTERQAIERGIFDQAVAKIEGGSYPGCRSIVFASRDWHQGVIGIVASRLVERYHRPSILLAVDEYGIAKGSGRSIPGFHLLDALKACSGLLEHFGGHRHAAGVGLKEENIDGFTALFEETACRVLGDSELVPLLDIDAEILPDELVPDLVNELQRMGPFGAGNPEPNLIMRGVTVVSSRTVGDGHLKLRVSAGGLVFDAIAFRQSECRVDGRLDIAFIPEYNSWNGGARLQLRIKAIRNMEI